MIPGTLRELLAYNEYADARLLDAAAERTDEELDRPFEMGEGSLRKTIFHLWAADECWLQRWLGAPVDENDHDMDVADVRARIADTAARRARFFDGHDAASLKGTFCYKRPRWMGPGPDLELPFDVSILHILNHGPHHRAQAVNMLKRLGAAPPNLSYLEMRGGGTPDLDVATLRRYLAHGDWAWRKVYEAATALPEEARNREFPVGPGTIHKILRHLADAPEWWMENIENGPAKPFPAIDPGDAWDALWSRYAAAARRRDAHLATLGDADLLAHVSVAPRPGVERRFAKGAVMLQLCIHGTHHRAQSLNMLRLTGAEVPSLDVNVWFREGAPVLV